MMWPMPKNDKVLESGWRWFRRQFVPEDAPEDQVWEMRFAFMAGAHYLFSNMITTTGKRGEMTDADRRRMDGILKELHDYAGEVQGRGRRD